MDSNAHEDELLVRYLLRSLPEHESERIDELSVTDDEVAWRLRSVEDDLIDAYVRDELSGTRRTQFESVYLATPERRNRVARARALSTAVQREVRSRGVWKKWAIAAALAIAIPSVWLLSMRDTAAPSPAATTVSSAEPGTLPPRPAPASAPAAPAVPPPISVVSLLLPPPTRAVRNLEVVDLRGGAGQVELRLQLESNDFPAYRGALRDLQRNEIVWQSESLSASREAELDVVALTLPSSVLDEQNYSLELSGVPASGRAELIASYPFGVKEN